VSRRGGFQTRPVFLPQRTHRSQRASHAKARSREEKRRHCERSEAIQPPLPAFGHPLPRGGRGLVLLRALRASAKRVGWTSREAAQSNNPSVKSVALRVGKKVPGLRFACPGYSGT
jgi:hypothetical protein